MKIPLCLSSERKILLEILLVGINVFLVEMVVIWKEISGKIGQIWLFLHSAGHLYS